MKHTFTDRPATTWWQHLAHLRRRGWVSMGAGACIVGLLVAGNVAILVAGDTLRHLDAAYQQPPHWLLFQRLLYQPADRLVPCSAAGDNFGMLSSTGTCTAEARPGARLAVSITSQPRYTAVVGRPYRYRVQAPTATRFYLARAPAGMTVDSTGLITWTPNPAAGNTVGRLGETVEVVAQDPEGAGSIQTFRLIVSDRVHPLGTDQRGLDIGAALVLGTQWSVFPGLVAVSVSLLLGLLFGGPAGYYEGRTDVALSYLVRVSEAFPALVLLFLAAVISGYRLYVVMIVLGVILFPGVARGVRARVQALRARQFIEASKELGLSDGQILWRDIIWHNTRPFLLTRVFYGFALAIVVEVTLSYLKLGVQPPAQSWGLMINQGRELIPSFKYWPTFFPALATVVAVAGYYLLGNGLAQWARIKHT